MSVNRSRLALLTGAFLGGGGIGAASGKTAEQLRPTTVDFSELAALPSDKGLKPHSLLETALTREGLVQVAGLPDYARLRTEVLRAAHGCLAQSPPSARAHSFEDGTLRRTIAAAVSKGVATDIEHGSDAAPCLELDHVGKEFRKVVSEAAQIFAGQLDALLGVKPGQAEYALKRGGPSAGGYGSVQEAVMAGERLEHFHLYEAPEDLDDVVSDSAPTLDFHVDQGFFIAFAPAMLMDASTSTTPKQGSSSGSFFLRLEGGREVEVEFDPNSLVFMLGDGVNQYIDRGLAERIARLRTPSHAFRMPRHGGVHRAWYGMMQLPPMDAMHQASGYTFGEIREQIVLASQLGESDSAFDSQKSLYLGCSHELQARQLQGHQHDMGSCAENQMMCWHRCMDMNPTPEVCESEGSEVKCVDQFDQLFVDHTWAPKYFSPQCSNSTSDWEPQPSVGQPGSDEVCTGWDGLALSDEFAYSAELVEGETLLRWSILDDKIKMRMVHKGRVGWMAIGLKATPAMCGANGASIVMGRNFESGETTVAEYSVHAMMPFFDKWKTPLTPSALQDTSMTVDSCYSMMEFTADSMHGTPIDLSSNSTAFVWALSRQDYSTDLFGGYSGYHGGTDARADSGDPRFRGFQTIDLVPPVNVEGADHAFPRQPVASALIGIATVSMAFVLNC